MTRTIHSMSERYAQASLYLIENVFTAWRDPEEGRVVRALTEEIRRAGDCLSLKSLAVGGQDLMDAGIRPGKAVGETLNRLLELVLDHPEYNQKEILIRYALKA